MSFANEKQWIKKLLDSCSKQTGDKESLWSRVSEMVHAYNGHRMKADCLPVGVDCTLSPIPASGIPPLPFNLPATLSPVESPVKRVVCSPDLPAYPVASGVDIVDSSTSQSVQETSPKYQCPVCGEGYNQRISLTVHLKTHHTPREGDPYKCSFCGKIFSVPARLTRHYRTHTGEKPYTCEYCKKSFSVKENLSVHKRIHTKERPYKCDVCDRAFEHSGKLHRHMRIHTGERPHKCSFCSKTFIQSGQLVIHLRTHTGEKPYVCGACHKGFTCSKQLKVHTRTHTGEKPYSCDICGKSFGYNHVLKLHQVAHYGEKVYKCTICKQTFTSKKSMEIHIKSCHSADGPSTRTDTDSVCTSSSTSSDKENKLELTSAEDMQQQFSGIVPTSVATTSTAELQNMSPAAEFDFANPTTSESETTRTYWPSRMSPNLIDAEELITTYKNNNPLPHPSRFQIPAAGPQYYNPPISPSSMSDSSQSSILSRRLEIDEQQEPQNTSNESPSFYLMPNYDYEAASASNVSYVVTAMEPPVVEAQPILIDRLPSPANGSPLLLSGSSNHSPVAFNSQNQSPVAFTNSPNSPIQFTNSPSHSPTPFTNSVAQSSVHYANSPNPSNQFSNSPNHSPSRFTNSPNHSLSEFTNSLMQFPTSPTRYSGSSNKLPNRPESPSPPVVQEPHVHEELILPPRKRSKSILKSMEREKLEDANFRFNSVIQFAKASG